MADRLASPGAATGHLTRTIPEWQPRSPRDPCLVGVLAGEGIGPEVVEAALLVVEAVTRAQRLPVTILRAAAPAGGRQRSWLTSEGIEFCEQVFAGGGALFCGPLGGRAVYELRGRFDLYCKLVPLRPLAALADASVVRPERLTEVDVLIVRENLGGVYAGEFGRREGGRVAYQTFAYHADQVERIVQVAARLAVARRGRLTVTGKVGGVPEVSALWRETAEAVASEHGLTPEILEIDNASYQLIADPRRFDVVLAPNFLGDVLADSATVLLGSRGLSYSANYGPQGRAAYQTGHGAAHDLTALDRANPVAQIQSAALMLHETFGLVEAAACIRTAVENVLAAGWRTPDIAGPASRVAGTRQLAELIAEDAAALARDARKIA